MRRAQRLWIVVFAIAGFAAPVLAASGALVTLYVSDPLTGAAMGGYDPVSYFTEGDPLPGRPEFEHQWMGVPWYFATAANRDVFVRDPEVYAPQFGGYGTMALARGYLSAGNPRVWLAAADKLFLFYSTSNREAFMLSQRGAYQKALQNWGELSQDLTGPVSQ